MTDYQFALTLEAAEGTEPQIRMWIDDQLAADLASEREVTLVHDGANTWSGNFSADGAFIYRVGIVSRPGSCWSLEFRSAEDAQELLFDSDELTMSKEWLVGTCEDLDVRPLRSLHDASRPAGVMPS